MMASFGLLSTAPTTTAAATTTTKNPLLSKTRTSSHRFKVSCNGGASIDNNDKSLKNSETPKLILPKTSLETQNVDRRNLLLGLGGLYGAANLTSIPSAIATPITAPNDISDCVTASSNLQNSADTVRGLACCPPVLSSKEPKLYKLPKDPTIRVRPAAQRASPEYIAKYQAAIAAMKALPDDHPHSWKQQARIHCAYCNGGYNQGMTGHPELQLQIHNSWLFFPFHRWYLYFYERILGKLIGDPTFAIPYWNWDNPTGMMLPAMFEAPYGDRNSLKANPIFDPYRDATHLPPAILDVQYPNPATTGTPCISLISSNLSSMYNQMVTAAPDTISFFGGEFKAGDDPLNTQTTVGSIERGVHTSMHRWVGDPRMANNEDMGNFYSAGYDPLFYVHHANVDRMWHIWKHMGIPGHEDPVDPNWRDASYVFYDENEELVRVFNKQCRDINRLGYEYERSEIPWLHSRPTPHAKGSKVAARSIGAVKKVDDVKFPVRLNDIVKVLVKRPAINRTKEEKAKENEILFLNGVQFDGQKFLKFDVFVNDVDDGIPTSAAESEFAGTFAQLQHSHGDHSMKMTSGARFGLTELLEDIEAEDDEYVVVALVPRVGCEDVTVSEIKIELVPVPAPSQHVDGDE